MRVPKLPRKSLIFLLLLIGGDIELCLDCMLNKIWQIYQNWEELSLFTKISGPYSLKKDILETLFTNEKFIITLPEMHIASVNSKLFQIPGFKFVQRNWIAGEGEGVAMYLSDDLKWKQ